MVGDLLGMPFLLKEEVTGDVKRLLPEALESHCEFGSKILALMD